MVIRAPLNLVSGVELATYDEFPVFGTAAPVGEKLTITKTSTHRFSNEDTWL